jgi:uncharacterized delta-60 repeat protein
MTKKKVKTTRINKLTIKNKTMKTRLLLISIVAVIFSLSSAKAQNAGELYTGFNGTGYYMQDFYSNIDVINDVALQEDHKIVAAGVSFTAAWNVEVNIVRVDPEGNLDVNFGTNGAVNYAPPVTGYYEAHAMSVCIKDDGKILVAGGVLNESFQFDFLLIQLNPDGSFDADFGTNGISIVSVNQFGTMAQDMVIDGDGKILLAGTVGNADFMNTPAVVRINTDGSLDETFGNMGVAQLPVVGSDNEFSSICLQPDGKILASGHISLEREPWVYYFAALVARFNADGSLDNTFGTDGTVVHNQNDQDDEFFGMDLNADGEIICGGFTNVMWETFDMFMMKFDVNGNPVADFGDNGVVTFNKEPYNVIYDLLVQSDNKILVCGSIGDFAPGNNDFALVRFLENGDLDNSFGNYGYVLNDFFGEQDEINSLALDGNDKIYVGGKSLNSNGTNRDFTIACYVNDISTSVSSSPDSREVNAYPNPASDYLNIDNCIGSEVSVYSTDGKLQYSAVISNEHFRIDVSNMHKGIYAVVISGEAGITSTKVVVD